MANNYTTNAKVESYLGYDIPASDSAYIQDLIDGVEAWIDRYLGTSFQNPTSESRYYDIDRNHLKELVLDKPVSSVTEVITLDEEGDADETLVADDDYRLYPYNEDLKTSIRLMPNSTIGHFPIGKYRVKVTGVFGATTVPDDIEVVATKLVSKIYNEGQQKGNLQSVTLGDYSATYQAVDELAVPMNIYSVLDQYRVMEL